MKELLYRLVGIIAVIHEKILGMNDTYQAAFSDKELHFLVMGILGLGMIFLYIHCLSGWQRTNMSW